MRYFSNYVLLLRYFILKENVPSFFSCGNTLNITHDIKGFSKFSLTVLRPFKKKRLSHFEKILITESGTCQSSNW